MTGDIYQTVYVMFLKSVTMSYARKMMVMTEYIFYGLIHVETIIREED